MNRVIALIAVLILAGCQTSKKAEESKPPEASTYKIDVTSEATYLASCAAVERIHGTYGFARAFGQTSDRADLREAQLYYVAHAVCLTPYDRATAANLALAAAKASLDLANLTKNSAK